MPKKGVPKKKSAAIAQGSSRGPGVAKKKHTLVVGSGKRALVKRLQGEAGSSKTARSNTKAKSKARNAKATNAIILSAVDGMKASLDELLAANEETHRQKADAEPAGSSLTSKRWQKLVAEETKHMQAVLQHPAFVANPFGALQEHLSNTMAAMEEKAKDREQSRSKRR